MGAFAGATSRKNVGGTTGMAMKDFEPPDSLCGQGDGDGNGEPEDVMVVSGRVIFDHVGRSVKQYYPNTEALGSAGLFNPAFDLVAPTITEYDVLDRPLKVTIPDTTRTTFDYGFGTDRDGKTQFQTRVTDANGVSKDSFRDVRQLITAVKEYNKGGSEVIWTSYQYDPLKQITDVLDAQQNLTTAEYDLLGRRTVLDNPDTGKVEMVYDPAGNLIHKITPNLRAQGQSIDYRYDYNRLTAIEYPEFTGNNIAYEYGKPGDPHNGANRIIKVTDQAGWETRQYGPLGELVESTRNIKWSAGPAESYTTQYQYDTWNRLKQLIYPDNEVLTYEYNKGGQMRAVHGKKGKYDYPYVQALHYDKFEQRTWLHYGNNTENRYTYNRNNRRMSHLTAGKGDGNNFMQLEYGYDDVGNITTLSNSAPVNSPSQMGGVTHFNYRYDDLYRLTYSDGTFDTQPDKQHAYTLDMAYDTVHNITSKVQHHTLKNRSGKAITQKKTSYDWSGAQGYKYDGSQPHAPTHIGERAFSYDANGNQLGWAHDKNGTRRTITWDEENRIQAIQDNGHTFSYTYDASGQRITKRGPQGETGYINQWMTLRNGEVGTKHVFAGTTRVVSKLVKQDRPNSRRNSENNTDSNGNGNGKARIVYEKDQYYFHPDHLGTTSYITHTNGQVYQHLEYFPFGETWVEEHSNKQRTPYLFTGKELDEETGLYYFGARYYDPRTSVWASMDPILESYVGSSVEDLKNSGVFGSANLALMSYSYNNPAVFYDPDGNAPDLFERKAMHEKAVAKHIAYLKTQGYTKFKENVRITIPGVFKGDDSEGYEVTRIVDIAAMKPGQDLKDAKNIEIKTVYSQKDKNKARKLARRAVRRLNRGRDIGKYVRGGHLISQMIADVHLYENGAEIQSSKEQIEPGSTMEWNIYKYGDDNKLSNKPIKFDAMRGKEMTDTVRETFIEGD